MTEAVPVDDEALRAVEHALGGCLTFAKPEGGYGPPLDSPRRVGADYGLDQLLDFWAGIDPNEEGTFVGYGNPLGGEPVPIYEMPGVYLTRDDLIRALIAEIRRLRPPPSPDRSSNQ